MNQERKRRLLAVLIVGCLLALTGCAGWTGGLSERIDAEIDQVDFADVGRIVCDDRRGVSVGGSATPVRTVAVAGVDNAEAVLELLLDAGFTRDEDFADVREFTRLGRHGVLVDIRILTEEGRQIGYGSCESPPEGAVEVRASI